MKLTVEITVDNSAFDDMDQEISRILREEADIFSLVGTYPIGQKQRILDKNGMDVGHWILTDIGC